MHGSVNRLGRRFLLTIGAACLAVAAIAAQQRDTPRQPSALNAVPANLGPAESFTGTPWIGQPPVTVTVAELMAREANAPPISETAPPRRHGPAQAERFDKTPAGPAEDVEAQSSPRPDGRTTNIAFNIATNFRGTRVAESGFVPPDSNGAVGPTQVLVTSNGRFKVFDKVGALGTFNVSDQTFWSPVMTVSPGGTFVTHPHVRYDRLSGRWFISEIDVPLPCRCSNRILIAVSSGSTITDSSSFTLYAFQHDSVGATPNPDTGGFADYNTLGVDANALYIGVHETNAGIVNSTGYVVRKSSVLSGGPPVVTAFRQLMNPASFSGPFAPQGVDNDNAAATEGYFIDVDGQFFNTLALRRIANPGSAPSISGTIIISVNPTRYPIPQLAQGSVRPLDALDDRLFAAMIKKNRVTGVSSLWTAHNIGVNSSGVAGVTAADRNAGRWYQLDNLTTTPTVTQAGTVFDGSAMSPAGFWMNSVAANGQGHAAIAQSWAGPTIPPSLAVFSRVSSDPANSMTNGLGLLGIAGYNLETGGLAPQAWGSYSQVVVDPTDDMTMWTFQEYADAANSWGVRAVRLQAPPPADVTIVSPFRVHRSSSVTVMVTGTSISGSGFFDPGPGFPNHISAVVGGGVIVNSATFIDSLHVSLNLNTAAASPSVGGRTVQIINPDGQASGPVFLFQVVGVETGDFDGDSKVDPAIYRPSTGLWGFLKSSTGFTTSATVSWGLSTDIPVPGDYDGDGKTDPAVYRPSTGLWAILKSSTNYTTSATVSWGLSTDVPVQGDFDGDGKTDLAIYRPSTGLWAILNSSTSYSTATYVSWGLSTDVPVRGDYDGDGKNDPAIYRPSTGLWAVLKSSTGYGTSFTVAWGLSTDVAVPGDYDGDGKSDPAIFRPSTGLWAILKSSTSYSTSSTVSWGVSTDIPVPADYDGDFKTDPAVFRPSTGGWFVLKSSTAYSTSFGVSWGLSTDSPINRRP